MDSETVTPPLWKRIRRAQAEAEPPWHPNDLLVGAQGFYVDFANGEGYTREGSNWNINGHIFRPRGSPSSVDQGIRFNASNSELLVGAEGLADYVRDYPLTMALNVVRVDSGAMDMGVIVDQARYYALRPSSSGNTSAVTRNTNYTSSGISSSVPGGVSLGDFRSDRTAVYANGRGPEYHSSQPTLAGRTAEISLGGMSDSSPDYGTGIIKRAFMINRSLSDEERERLLEYMSR